jgi:hypothetical protein
MQLTYFPTMSLDVNGGNMVDLTLLSDLQQTLVL